MHIIITKLLTDTLNDVVIPDIPSCLQALIKAIIQSLSHIKHKERSLKCSSSCLHWNLFAVAPLALTFDAKAAGIQLCPLAGGHIHLQTQLLQGPAVGLGHILTGGRDVGLRYK